MYSHSHSPVLVHLQGFDFYIKAEDPDIIILTETKVDKEIDHKDIKDRWQVRQGGIKEGDVSLPFSVARRGLGDSALLRRVADAH